MKTGLYLGDNNRSHQTEKAFGSSYD